MKKGFGKLRKPIIITILALLVVSYYIYLTHRNVNNDDKMTSNSAVSEITARDLEKNYPGTPRAVVSYFADIQKIWYKEDITGDELTGLAQHARALFDDELLAANDYEQYMNNLRNEITSYKEKESYITECIVEDGYDTEYKTFQNKSYAFVNTKYYVKDNKNLSVVYEKYTLRKDSDSHWKILFWEVTDGTEMEEK